MYTINVTNNYVFPVTYLDKTIPSGGGTFSTGSVGGGQIFNVPGVGPICVIDIGQDFIKGYQGLPGAWGVLIRFQTVEVYARYDAEGGFNLTIDRFGDLTVDPQSGSAMLIQLSGLTLKQTPVAIRRV